MQPFQNRSQLLRLLALRTLDVLLWYVPGLWFHPAMARFDLVLPLTMPSNAQVICMITVPVNTTFLDHSLHPNLGFLSHSTHFVIAGIAAYFVVLVGII